MTLEIETLPAFTVAKLSGQVDTLNATELETRLTELADQKAHILLIDCSDMNYINSAGLRVFLIVAKKVESQGAICAFCGLNPNVKLVFETIGFDRILKLFETRILAMEKLVPPQAQAA